MVCPRAHTWIYASPLALQRFGWIAEEGWQIAPIDTLRTHPTAQHAEMEKCPAIALVEEALLPAVLDATRHLAQRRRMAIDTIALLPEPQLEGTLNAIRRGAGDVLYANATKEDVLATLLVAALRVLGRIDAKTVLRGGCDQLAALQALKEARNRLFPGFASDDAAWDILVFVVEMHMRNRFVPVGNAILAASVSNTAGLRKVDWLVEQGLLARVPDPDSKRRILLIPTESLLTTFQNFRLSAAGWSEKCFACPRFELVDSLGDPSGVPAQGAVRAA